MTTILSVNNLLEILGSEIDSFRIIQPVFEDHSFRTKVFDFVTNQLDKIFLNDLFDNLNFIF